MEDLRPFCSFWFLTLLHSQPLLFLLHMLEKSPLPTKVHAPSTKEKSQAETFQQFMSNLPNGSEVLKVWTAVLVHL